MEYEGFNELKDLFDFLSQQTEYKPINKAEKVNKLPIAEEDNCQDSNCWKHIELAKDIYMQDINSFSLFNSVKDVVTDISSDITFAHKKKDGYYCPGITEKQLINILMFRNKNNPKRYNLLKQLLD